MKQTQNKIYFGLTFPDDFPLNENSCSQLAEILLLNPRISVTKVREIINNKSLWGKIKLMIETLSCELLNISLINPEATISQLSSIQVELLYKIFQLGYPDEDFDFVVFKKKLLSWNIEFTFPLPYELERIAKSVKVTEETMTNLIYKMLFLKEMPVVKCIEYLNKYHKFISKEEVNDILDLYSFRHNNQKPGNLQLSLFSDSIINLHNQ